MKEIRTKKEAIKALQNADFCYVWANALEFYVKISKKQAKDALNALPEDYDSFQNGDFYLADGNRFLIG